MKSESFKQLSELLPESLGDLQGGPFEGWAPEVNPGVKFTMVKRAYKANGKRIDLSITDAGKSTLPELNIAKTWLGLNIDRNLKGGGNEKTRTFNGFPAFQRTKDSFVELIKKL